MAGLFVLLAVSLTLAALYITGTIKPPLLAKTLSSCAFAAVAAYALFILPLFAQGTDLAAASAAAQGTDLAAASANAQGTDLAARLSPFRVLIFAGLLAGVAGDILLEIFDKNDRRFFLGVAAFFAGHALYVAAFFNVDAAAAPLALLCAFPAAALLTVLSAKLLTFQGARRLILLGYMFALSFMCAFAWVILIRQGLAGIAGQHRAAFAMIAPGAILFLVSDTSLGLQLFGNEKLTRHSRLLGTICLITYYLAQNLIALSTAF